MIWVSGCSQLKKSTVSLQNLDVEIRRIRLDELSSVLPYFPEVSGLLSAEAHYIQREKSLSVSTEATIDALSLRTATHRRHYPGSYLAARRAW